MADQYFSANCGFFDSINRDRLYTAEQMNRPYKRLVSNGVFATPAGTPSTDLQVVSAGSGMNIIVKKGEGIFADKWFQFPNDTTITVQSNVTLLPRIDSVIVQIDKRQSGRLGRIVYRTGTPASYPLPPDLSTTENLIEYRASNIYVAASANYIGQDAIVDLRGSDECPWVTHLLQQVDTSTLYDQYRAAYDAYYNQETERFNEFMRQLTEQLTVQTNIIKLESHYVSVTNGETVIPINIADYDKNQDVLIVRVNRLFASEFTDYTIAANGENIILTKDIYAGQNVDFLVLKSVVIGDNETVIELVQALSANVSSLNTDVTALKSDSDWINFTLESGTAFDDTVKPAIRKVGNEVYIRGAIKGLDTVNVPICTLPTNMRPAMNHQYTAMAISNNGIAASCVLEVRSTGSIYLIAKSGTIPETAMLSIATQFVLG